MDTAPQPPPPSPRGLTKTQEKILQAVGDLGIATADDITRLLFKKGSKSYVARIMAELAGGGDYHYAQYLCRFGMPQSRGNFERMYSLGRRGRDYVRALGGAVHYSFRVQKASPYSFSFLRHHHGLTQFLIALHVFARRYPAYQMGETLTGFAMVGRPPTFTRCTDDGETTITVLPDAWVSIERAHKDAPEIQSFFLWIEIDCGTEAKAKFQQLVRDRINLVRYKGYEVYFGVPSVLFCYVAVGSTSDYRLNRLHTMRQWTAQVLAELKLDDWAAVFRFSTLLDEECLYDRLVPFIDPVWYLPASDTLVPLFPPPTDKEESYGTDNPQTNPQSVASHTDSGNTCRHLPQRESTAGFPV